MRLEADAVFILSGYHPDTSLFEGPGIKYNPKSLEPEINEQTLETSIDGLYLAGSIIAGRNANRIFIENSRAHGKQILDNIIAGT
jgi:thioredoxin reductase (NADPH)